MLLSLYKLDMNPLEYWEMASRGGDPIDIKMCELALHYLTPASF